jgi:endonuclease I
MSLGYNQARDFMFNQLDVNANGQLECPYSGRFATPDGTRTPGTFNTEHSWPQSDAAGDTTANNEPARSDLHHLFPTDATANSARGNFDFGWTDCGTPGQGACGWAMAGSKLGPQRGNPSVTVFEVRPKYRGDMARAHFYFAVRYNRPIPAAEEATLRAWHCEDPPDDVERLRNDRIGVRQGRRNPFVDRPDFVERISDF